MKRSSTPAMLLRNKLGTQVLMRAPEEEIQETRRELAKLTLEPQLKAALDLGITPGQIGYMAKKIAAGADRSPTTDDRHPV